MRALFALLLTVVLATHLDPGDLLLTESLTYAGLKSVAGLLHLQDRLVDALLLHLHFRTDVLQLLVGLGDVGDQGGHADGCGVGVGVRQTGNGQRYRDGEGQRADRPGSPDGAVDASGRAHLDSDS